MAKASVYPTSNDNFDREVAKQNFLIEAGFRAEDFISLPADASFRRYSRFQGNQPVAYPVLLMDSPARHEPVGIFADLADFLNQCDLRAPRIFARCDRHGFLLLEDLGLRTYTQMIEHGTNADALMETSLQSLIKAHDNPALSEAPCGKYTVENFIEETGRIIFWYWPLLKGTACPETVKNDYIQAWRDVFAALPDGDISFVHRDFHFDNLIHVEHESGHRSCGWIDFQDGLIGSIAYDLATVIYNERRDMAANDREKWFDYYCNNRQKNFKADYLKQWLPVMVAQRQSKVLGLFYRLLIRDGKDVYLIHQPRVAGLLAEALQDNALTPVRKWWEAHLGVPQALPLDDKKIDLIRNMKLDDTLNIA